MIIPLDRDLTTELIDSHDSVLTWGNDARIRLRLLVNLLADTRQALDRTMAESQRLVTALSVGKGNKSSRSE